MTCLVGVVISGVVRLGPLRVSGYGLCAAVGLVGALWLSLRTARMVGLEPAEIWDAGLFGLGAAFVVSRALLVVRDPRAFRMYPMLVLALPSFTYLGMALTAVAVLVYLRVKRLPLLAVMDAWAPCGAVLGAALCLGHFVEGTDLGMPWGFGGRLLPVQVMGAVLVAGLAWLLFRILGGERSAGRVAGSGLLDAGIVCFFLDMIEQPSGLAGNAWLDPSQWIALGSLIVGWVVLHTHPNPPLSREKAALILEHFVLGGGGPHDHEELEYTNSTDPLVLEASRRFVDVQSEFPVGPGEPGYCNEQGKEVLLDYARRLRGDSASLEKERV